MNPQHGLRTGRSFSAAGCRTSVTNRGEHATPGKSRQRPLFGAAAGAVLAAVSTAAPALETELSGQVNRALMWADDGLRSETYHVDNDVSSTRFRFVGSEQLTPQLKAGVRFEVEFQSNPSNAVSQTTRTVDPELDERQVNVFFQSGFGTVVVGQAPGAADGSTELDLSGTSVVQGALGTNAIGGGILFASGGAISGVDIGDVISNQDFESRYDLVRYQAPALGPVKLVISTGTKDDEDVSEAALEFEGDAAGGKLVGALGLSAQDAAGNDDEVTGGSVSWLASSGLSLTLATSTREVSTITREGKFNYFKVGYRSGRHAVAVDYATGEDQAATGDEADMVGLSYVYKPARWAEIYVGAKQYSLDRPGNDFDDMRIVAIGSRLKF